MTRVEYLSPPPLDYDKLFGLVGFHTKELMVKAKGHHWELALQHAEMATVLLKLVAIHAERTAHPIRVEHPDG